MAKKYKGPSKTDAQERIVRKEKDLNPTGKVLWLLTSLSGTKGYAFMAEDLMAAELNITKRQLRNSLAFIEQYASDLFGKVKPPGIHRVNQWHRQYLPKEEPHEFVRRVQSHPIMDVCVGLHWVAIDQAKDTGVAEFPANGLWPVTAEALRLARGKMNALGYFTVVSDPKTGKPATYTLNEARFAAAHDPQEAVEQQGKPKPTPAWVAKQQKIEEQKIEEQRIERERLAGEQEERRQMLAEQHQKALAAEMQP